MLYVLEYVNEDEYRKLERSLKKYNMLAYKKLIFEYINKIDLTRIEEYICNLRKYTLSKLKAIKDINIYNDGIKTSVIAFNYEGIDAFSLAEYLNKYKICVRAGNHCAKILKDEIGINNTCRISLYFYNNKEEIDRFIEVMKGNKDIFRAYWVAYNYNLMKKQTDFLGAILLKWLKQKHKRIEWQNKQNNTGIPYCIFK